MRACPRWRGAGKFARIRFSDGAEQHARLRRREASKPSAIQTCDFVLIVPGATVAAAPAGKAAAAPIIEVKLAGATVRVSELGDGAELTAVLRAIRASAAKA